jgi:hypothetical protein
MSPAHAEGYKVAFNRDSHGGQYGKEEFVFLGGRHSPPEQESGGMGTHAPEASRTGKLLVDRSRLALICCPSQKQW